MISESSVEQMPCAFDSNKVQPDEASREHKEALKDRRTSLNLGQREHVK